MDIKEGDLRAAVYGELFDSAKTQMGMIDNAIKNQTGKGFKSDEECAQWAKEHLLDVLVVGKAQHQFYYVSHFGELFTLSAWKRYYAENVLFIWEWVSEKEQKPRPWCPTGFEYHNAAKIIGEVSDGIRKPLNHRDYFTPTGFYDDTRETFNSAKPFPVHAKETGRNTSHIYTYIRNIAGECSDHLLAWLRHKCMYPTIKTEVVPVIVSRTQGNGKTTFAEVICKGLFGEDNVLVTDQYDANARFNADYADALVVCAEEKEEDDKRAAASALKSRSTARTIRKEHKGLDPIYQANYTEFVVTTNKDVPIQFESTEMQRRFMVMGSNPNFTRETSDLANEVFNKLYGYDNDRNKVGVPFTEDHDLIAQFKHELVTNKELENVNLHNFPKTAEYERCFSLPRTSERVEIDSILRSIAPFIKQSLMEGKLITEVPEREGSEQMMSLTSFVTTPTALQYMLPIGTSPAYIALCRPLVFYDQQSGKPFNHAVVERGILDCAPWLLSEYGLRLLPSQLPIPGGFMHVLSRYRQAPAARLSLVDATVYQQVQQAEIRHNTIIRTDVRIGERLRINGQWKPDMDGEYETVNEMKPGVTTLEDKNKNVQYMDTFLFEADDVTKQIYMIEQSKLKSNISKEATTIFMERLRLQRSEANRLMDEGKAFRVVYSGGKSYHILSRIKDAPDTLDEYKWLHAHLATSVMSTKLDFDPACNDPARLTRAPITRDRYFMYNGVELHGVQELYRETPGIIFDYKWRAIYEQWKNRPLDPWEQNGRRLRPVKEEYRNAMWALLKGTFWTEYQWNGRRQQCFFPAYRLCRLMGYSHDQLWDKDGILDGLNKYYRKGEINYWRTRENCDLIQQIDKDVDLTLEEESNVDN
jgi:hypothetical protein